MVVFRPDYYLFGKNKQTKCVITLERKTISSFVFSASTLLTTSLSVGVHHMVFNRFINMGYFQATILIIGIYYILLHVTMFVPF